MKTLKIPAWISVALPCLTIIVLYASAWLLLNPDAVSVVSAQLLGCEFLGKEGVVLQTNSKNCGPSALKMVFNYYKIPSALSEIEEGVHVNSHGTSMLALKEMAEMKGLRAEGWRLTLEDLCGKPLPAILFIRRNHFVVADSIRGSMVFLSDPAVGKVKMETRKLREIWQGESLLFKKRN